MPSFDLQVNGHSYTIEAEAQMPLLWALREHLQLTGTKFGCGVASCGACTVRLNGDTVKSCTVLAVQADGSAVQTIEGLAQNGELHPLQAAFIECDGFQCGGCTAGQIMSAAGLLQEPVGPDDAAVRDSMSGNLCRCGAYPGILEAIQSVRCAPKT